MDINIKLEIDNRAREIEFCRLENIKFEPSPKSFMFVNGRWIAEHTKFPIDNDNELDLIILVTGNPGSTCQLIITVNTNPPITVDPLGEFNHTGRTIFSTAIKIQ